MSLCLLCFRRKTGSNFEGGANPNVNCQGDIVPALSLAARYESHVSIMVRYGAQIYGQDKEHTSILCYFSNGWDYQALGVFLRKGADPNTICQKGIPFLLKVAMFGTKEQITTVIFYEPKDTPLPNGCTAVDMVLKRRETRSVEELEAKGYRASADYLCTESFTQVVEQTFH